MTVGQGLLVVCLYGVNILYVLSLPIELSMVEHPHVAGHRGAHILSQHMSWLPRLTCCSQLLFAVHSNLKHSSGGSGRHLHKEQWSQKDSHQAIFLYVSGYQLSTNIKGIQNLLKCFEEANKYSSMRMSEGSQPGSQQKECLSEPTNKTTDKYIYC